MIKQVRHLERLSMLLPENITFEGTKETIGLINLIDGLLDEFDSDMQGGKGLYRDQEDVPSHLYWLEMYTDEDWELWQIIASFERIKLFLSTTRYLLCAENEELKRIIEMRKKIAELILIAKIGIVK